MMFSRRASARHTTLSVLVISIAFVSGYLLGILRGLMTTTTPLEVLRNDPLQNAPREAHLLKENLKKKNDGWHSIDVFYGNSTHLPLENETRVWYSQVHQDEVVHTLFRGKTNGYFVDLAANDATVFSNTFALEKRFGWSGICIEPNPVYWSNLTYRDCQVVAAVVGNKTMDEVHFRFEAGDHGGIAGNGFDNGPRWQRNSLLRYTVTLEEIFERYDAPRHIDYVSLDVEGAEEFILQAFPLEKYTISVLTVERPTAGIRHIFEQYGYEKIMRLSRWRETLWVHKSVKESLDIEGVKKFDPQFLRQQGLE